MKQLDQTILNWFAMVSRARRNGGDLSDFLRLLTRIERTAEQLDRRIASGETCRADLLSDYLSEREKMLAAEDID